MAAWPGGASPRTPSFGDLAATGIVLVMGVTRCGQENVDGTRCRRVVEAAGGPCGVDHPASSRPGVSVDARAPSQPAHLGAHSLLGLEAVDEQPSAQSAFTRANLGDGKELCAAVREALEAAGLGLGRHFGTGAEITGLTKTYGSTGFSIRRCNPGSEADRLTKGGAFELHLVLDGKAAGLRYREGTDVVDYWDGEGYHPVNPERLVGRIRPVLEGLGLEVFDITYSGHSTAFDYDVMYTVGVDLPAAS